MKRKTDFSWLRWVLSLVICIAGMTGMLFAQNLVINPPALDMTVAPGLLGVQEIEVVNNETKELHFICRYDTTWAFIYPAEFTVPGEGSQKMMAAFFIRDLEASGQKGTIVFHTPDDRVNLTMNVNLTNPYRRSEPPVVKPEPPKEKAPDSLAVFGQRLAESLREEINARKLAYESRSDRVLIFVPGGMCFDPGQAAPRKKLQELLIRIGRAIAYRLPADCEIMVRGYADERPIGDSLKSAIPGNWELSALRAAAVSRILQKMSGIPGKRFTAESFSSFRPLVPANDENRYAQNRRVEIVIYRKKPETSAAHYSTRPVSRPSSGARN